MIENEIISLIQDTERIAILPHVSADGDALGSSLAMAMALKELNKLPVVYAEEEIPHTYSFLPGKEFFKVYGGNPYKYDLVLAVDTGDIERLGERYLIFKDANKTINIDHHPTNTEFAQINLVESGSSAAGEMVYSIIKKMGVTINKAIATCLYVAIATDTGSFRYGNTTSNTHRIIADLIGKGVEVAQISQLIFDTVSLPKVRLTGIAIREMEIHGDGKIALMLLTRDMLKEVGASEEDCDGLVNYGRNVEGVEVAIMIRQYADDEYKINLRSNKYVDVSKIAKKHLGGGHIRAAGCIARGNIERVKRLFIDEIKEVL
ncbi:MAG: bifunctional oligoribonuclease/PAP phosphatase NrnA [Clostridium sp.]|nr:bifunctional oligoribonuclease/PAP phosphatase NrnA [Clostridium sp.]